ncbi:MAG TPA: inositol monophosphatase family protein [Mycobacteriales bacterium]|nr:inositol monophosphatase family protein [Mycobacteriales bacterium]
MGETAALLDLAVRLAREAGALLLDRLPDARTGVTSKSSPTDVATDADRAAEALITETLRRERPGDAILAEEGTADTGTTGLRWVVDPLDGTVNYVYRAPAFCVSVAVEDADGWLAGAVYDPQRDELFTGARGEGSACDGAPLRCTGVTDLSRALVATGFSYVAADRAAQAGVLTRVLPAVRDIRRGGSAALEICGVAAGRVDAYYELGPAPWDRGAGSVIATEAGAVVRVLRTPDGRDLTVAAAPGVFDALVGLLREAGAVG